VRILDTSSKSLLGCALAAGLLVTPHGTKAATFEVLYSFKGGSDGAYPQAGVIADKAGNLYGTTSGGGYGNGFGTVFKLAPDGTKTVLWAFKGYAFEGISDGIYPLDPLIMDAAGNLYGTTANGGPTKICGWGPGGCGIVFKIAPDGTETVLYAFRYNGDGANPKSGLTMWRGELYGTTSLGGKFGCYGKTGCGTVFHVAPDGIEKVLYRFKVRPDGHAPVAGLFEKNGYLYGTTSTGGVKCPYNMSGCGTLFEIAPNKAETVLYSFHGQSDGYEPYGGVIADKSGNLYGTTLYGGGNGFGTVFKLATDGTFTVLHSFTSGSDGENPNAGVIADEAGNLYGTTGGGGNAGGGTIFKIAPDGTETVLYNFQGGSDGGEPLAGLLLRNGYLYGTATFDGGGAGSVFRLKL
jgi:uncharacterized repeat protein (TIGR03803 family)